MKDIGWNLTGDNLFVVFGGKNRTIPRSSPHFDTVYRAIDEGDVETVSHYMDAKAHIAKVMEGRVTFDGSNLMFNGEVMHNAIVTRLRHLWENKLPYTSLLKFFDRLMDNVDFRAVNELYGFLEACNLPITSDGHFLAYKKVRDDFKDIYSGTIDNSVGATPRVRRNEVDPDPNNTCSKGLHVCSKSYLGVYGTHYTKKVVMVKVDPANVVAVPKDYNNAKMRVCAYEVVEDISDEYYGGNDPMPEYHTDSYGDPDAFDPFDEDFEDDDFEEWDNDDSFDELEDAVDETPVAPVAKPVKNPHVTSAKLNEHQVRDIKQLLRQGELPIARIADVYNVNESTIRKIRDGVTWANVV